MQRGKKYFSAFSYSSRLVFRCRLFSLSFFVSSLPLSCFVFCFLFFVFCLLSAFCLLFTYIMSLSSVCLLCSIFFLLPLPLITSLSVYASPPYPPREFNKARQKKISASKKRQRTPRCSTHYVKSYDKPEMVTHLSICCACSKMDGVEQVPFAE